MVSETKRTDLDRRELAPASGLREFWYPALLDEKIGKKPVRLRMLDEPSLIPVPTEAPACPRVTAISKGR